MVEVCQIYKSRSGCEIARRPKKPEDELRGLHSYAIRTLDPELVMEPLLTTAYESVYRVPTKWTSQSCSSSSLRYQAPRSLHVCQSPSCLVDQVVDAHTVRSRPARGPSDRTRAAAARAARARAEWIRRPTRKPTP